MHNLIAVLLHGSWTCVSPVVAEALLLSCCTVKGVVVTAVQNCSVHDQSYRIQVTSTCLCIAEMSHFVSNGDGLVVTVDSESGDVLWIQNYASPVVAFYIWQREGLRKVLHTNVGIETLRYLTFMSGEVGHITKWKYPFPKETETKSKLT